VGGIFFQYFVLKFSIKYFLISKKLLLKIINSRIKKKEGEKIKKRERRKRKKRKKRKNEYFAS